MWIHNEHPALCWQVNIQWSCHVFKKYFWMHFYMTCNTVLIHLMALMKMNSQINLFSLLQSERAEWKLQSQWGPQSTSSHRKLLWWGQWLRNQYSTRFLVSFHFLNCYSFLLHTVGICGGWCLWCHFPSVRPGGEGLCWATGDVDFFFFF